MDHTAEAIAPRITPELFGDTDIAGGIPNEFRPSRSDGPVYFEGELVLSLSFQGSGLAGTGAETATANNPAGAKTPTPATPADTNQVDSLELWDCLTDTWFEHGPVIERYDGCDMVLVDGTPVYRGIVDSARDVTIVPGWDATCTAINGQYYLRWKARQKEARCSER